MNPFSITDDEYINILYSRETQNIKIYKHLSIERILSAKWLYWKNCFVVSDFGGLGKLNKNYKLEICLPMLSVWHKGKSKQTKILRYHTDYYWAIPNEKIINITISTLVYRVFNNYESNFKFNNAENRIIHNNGIEWDCRLENLIIENAPVRELDYWGDMV